MYAMYLFGRVEIDIKIHSLVFFLMILFFFSLHFIFYAFNVTHVTITVNIKGRTFYITEKNH